MCGFLWLCWFTGVFVVRMIHVKDMLVNFCIWRWDDLLQMHCCRRTTGSSSLSALFRLSTVQRSDPVLLLALFMDTGIWRLRQRLAGGVVTSKRKTVLPSDFRLENSSMKRKVRPLNGQIFWWIGLAKSVVVVLQDLFFFSYFIGFVHFAWKSCAIESFNNNCSFNGFY